MDVRPAAYCLPCAVEAPDAFVPKARHALRMLLAPLGFDPLWTRGAALKRLDVRPGLYYGPDPPSSPDVLPIRLREETLAFFDGRRPYAPDRARWRTWEGERWPVLFGADGEDDPVASAFFWLSGWQEHTVRARDRHGRFPYAASLQARWDLGGRPAVEAYRAWLAEGLAALGAPVQRRRWGAHAWAVCPTHDVDYLRKGRLGTFRRERQRAAEDPSRTSVLGRLVRATGAAMYSQDPFQAALRRMPKETRQRGGQGTYFFKTGATSPHDAAGATDVRLSRKRIAALERDGFEVGLHPSYHAHAHAGYLERERDRLAALVSGPIVSVRQHYLRYEAPATPRLHERAGFRIDSTLGWAEREGFRHATCLPFQLFDIERNAPLDVWEMPLALMDAALFNHRRLGPDEAERVTADVLATCRRFGGVAVALWHNVLWDERDYAGWGRHFLHTLDQAREEGALVTSLREALAGFLGRRVDAA